MKTQGDLANYVGGEWVGAVSGELEDVIDPATEEVIGRVPVGSAEDVDRAVTAASAALPGWLETTPAERAEMLHELGRRLDEHSEELVRLECLNVGKPELVAEPELPLCADNLRFFGAAARTPEGKATGEYMRGYTSILRREPVGVVGALAPWNYPLMMAVWKIGPALAAGNVVVLKPSEETPLTTMRLAELAADLFPPGVLNVITGQGDTVGAALVEHPKVDLVSLTGGVATGKAVMRAAAGTMTRLHLELGGKAPVVVFADADLDAVADAVRVAGYWNSGQECAAACRLLVAAEVHDTLLEKLVPAIESLRVGAPGEGAEVEMGPLITYTHRQRVLGFLDRAVEAGAEPLVGGNTSSRETGYFLDPVLLAGVEQDSECVQREIFGPVVTVQRFEDDAAAIAAANDVDYGLSASVWTNDLSRALEATRRLRFGTVWVNDHLPLVSEMPFGGFKHSGHGKDMSAYSLDSYSELKHVMLRH